MILWPIFAASTNQSHNWTQHKGAVMWWGAVCLPPCCALPSHCGSDKPLQQTPVACVHSRVCRSDFPCIFRPLTGGWHEGWKDGDTTWPWHRSQSGPTNRHRVGSSKTAEIIFLSITWHISSCWPAGTLIPDTSTVQRMVSSILPSLSPTLANVAIFPHKVFLLTWGIFRQTKKDKTKQTCRFQPCWSLFRKMAEGQFHKHWENTKLKGLSWLR